MKPLRLIGLVLAATLAFGCTSSNAALKAHTTAAQTLDDLASDAKELVLEQREAQLDAVAQQAVTDGLDPAALKASVERAAAKYDAGPAIPAVNAFIAAKDAYVRAVLVDAGKDEPSWYNAKHLLKDVIDTYTNLRAALGNPDKMPAMPDVIAKLLTRAPRPDGDPAEVVG